MDPNAIDVGGHADDQEEDHPAGSPPAATASVARASSIGNSKKKARKSKCWTYDSTFDSGGSVSSWYYDPMLAREELAKFIVSEDLPVRIGESRAFESMIQKGFCPQHEKLPRNFPRSDILACYHQQVFELKQIFAKGNLSFALTSDIWSTSYHRMAYLSVAAHYYDDNHSLNKRAIGFKLIEDAPSAEAIAHRILDVVKAYNLENRIVSVTLDNALANTRVMEVLSPVLESYVGGYVIHQRCLCDILNIIVQAGMAEMAEPLDNIRSTIGYIFSSEMHVAEFRSYCKAQGKKPRIFSPDAKVRWNSTYIMLKEVLPYKEVLTSFVNAHMQREFLSEGNWSLADKFFKILETFYVATTELSGVYNHTSCLVLLHLYEIALLFQSYRTDLDLFTTVRAMEEIFVKHFQTIPHLYCFAFIVDPRLKLSGLQQTLTWLGEALNIDYSNAYSHVADEFFRVLSLYEANFGSTLRKPLSKSEAPKCEDSSRLWKKLRVGASSSSSLQGLTIHQRIAQGEYNRYRDTNHSMDPEFADPDNVNLFLWWKNNQQYHPVLYQFARDVLSAPVSTVSSESAFSVNRRIVEDRRSCLAPEMVEALTCLKDRENAATREQHSVVNAEFASELAGLNL